MLDLRPFFQNISHGRISGVIIEHVISGCRKKQQEIGSANCENQNPRPRLLPEQLLTYFLWISASTTCSAYSLFSIQDKIILHKKPKYMNR